MRKKTFLCNLIILLALCSGARWAGASFLNAPHQDLQCVDCHAYSLNGGEWRDSSGAKVFPPASPTRDDQLRNFICLTCHDGSKTGIPGKKMHSSHSFNPGDQTWSVLCVSCHDPHFQSQLQHKNDAGLFLATGIISGVDTSTPGQSTIIFNSLNSKNTGAITADWTAKTSAGRGLILVIDTTNPTHTFEIIGTVHNGITVKGTVEQVFYTANETRFGIIYGQLLRDAVYTGKDADGDGWGDYREIRFHDAEAGGYTGDKNGDGAIDGVCQVCHTDTSHWTRSMAVDTHYATNRCTGCHLVNNGFKPTFPDHIAAGFVVPVQPCITCHTATDVIGGIHKNQCGHCHSQVPALNPGVSRGDCLHCHGATAHNSANDHDHRLALASCAACHAVGSQAAIDTLHRSDCTTCHAYGGGRLNLDPAAIANAISAGKGASGTDITCQTCHLIPHNTETDHDNRVTTGLSLDCTSCHAVASQANIDTLHRSDCATCHGYTSGNLNIDPVVVANAIATGKGTTGTPVNCEICHGVQYSHPNATHEKVTAVTECVVCHLVSSSIIANVHKSNCLGCHNSTRPEVRNAIDTRTGGACTTCHVAQHKTSVTVNTVHLLGQQDCVQCHYHAGSAHNNLSTVAACSGCHASTSFAKIMIIHLNDCLKCHLSGLNGVSDTIDAGRTDPGTPVNCQTCHAGTSGFAPAHGITNATAAASHDMFSPTATCSACHVSGTAEQRLALHPSCTTCHASSKSAVTGAISSGRAGSAVQCTTCHLGGAVQAIHHAVVDFATTNCQPCHASPWPSWSSGATAHQTHTVNGAPNLRGIFLACGSCHDTGNFPYFLSGDDANADGLYVLAETDVCNPCHSPGGSYDGVNNASFGARVNWANGVYSGGQLVAGKEKWCASCHDESPSVISGVTAPNIAGDEDGLYSYGSGWGFYKTGHGLPAASSYPASGGNTAGAAVECNGCHDFATAHIDGLARTFDDQESQNLDPSYYRQGYRLRLVAQGGGAGASGQEPMLVPVPSTTANSPNNYGLCLECHTNYATFTDPNDTATNFKTKLNNDPAATLVNRHEYHLKATGFGKRASSDWSNTACSSDSSQCNSRITCTTCHNVHGSTRLAMIHDGSLIGRAAGLNIWYYNSDLVSFTSPPETQPTPMNLPLSASTGTVISAGSSSNLCSHCHGETWLTKREYRTPFNNLPQAPVLSWPGAEGYTADGVNPDSAPGGSDFTFQVSYSDGNNDAPSVLQVWIDKDHDGYDDDHYDMTELDAGDTNYFDGKLYTFATPIAKHGDNTFSYRFYFASGADVASGDPAADHQFIVTNNAPTLAFTGEPNSTGDGVDPDIGGNGATFTFRVTYTDNDNEAPDADGVRVIVNGVTHTLDPEAGGSYSAGKIYSKAITLNTPGDLSYRFLAKDAVGASATGEPTLDHTVTVLASSNTPPLLEWVSGACLTEGVRPRTGAKNANYQFMVKYSDADNECPASIQVTVNGAPTALSSHDGGSCLTGRTYSEWITIATAGDLNYAFSASDGVDPATGLPTTNHVVSVINTYYKVKPAADTGWGGSGWSTTLADAYNAAPASGTVLVYPDSDFTPASYAGGLYNINKANRVLQSVCGSDLTIISGGGTVISLLGNDGAVIDGFTITGGTGYGIYSNADSLTVKNCEIKNNPTGIHLNNGCNPVSIQNTKIHHNSSYGVNSPTTNNSLSISASQIYSNGGGATTGPGVNLNGGATAHSITNSSLTANTTTGNGGAIYCNACSLTIDGCTISGNTAGSGGAIYLLNAASATISDTFIQGNQAGTAGAIYVFGSTGSATLTNVILTGNKATSNNGGAVYVNGSSSLTFCTLSGNYAANLAGALYHNSTGATTIRNSIVYNNDAANQPNYKQIYAVSNRWQNVDVMSTLISQIPGSATYPLGYENLGGNLHEGSRTIELPYFVDGLNPAAAPTLDGDYRLCGGLDDPAGSGCANNSSAINAASAVWASDHDIFNDPRPLGPAYDMGVHEKE